MSSQSISILGPGLLEALRILLKVVIGICEGRLHGLPWQALPLTHSVVKERLALAAFSSCSCSSLSISQTVTLGSGTLSNSGNWGRSLVIGCRCTGWQEGAAGTLACGRQDDFLLQQELLVLRFCFSNLSATNQACAPISSVHAIQNQFARINFLTEASKMAQAGESAGITDIKKNLRRLYEMLAISVMDNKEMAREVKSMGETVSYTSL